MKQMKRILALCIILVLAAGMLTACGGKQSSYEVLVNDEAGKPVQGVTVQFCSDTMCFTGETGENGIAVFEQEAGKYTVHILRVPEGYTEDKTEYPAPDKPGRVTIVLK